MVVVLRNQEDTLQQVITKTNSDMIKFSKQTPEKQKLKNDDDCSLLAYITTYVS